MKITVSTPTKNKSKARTAAIFGSPVFCTIRSIIDRLSSSFIDVLFFIFSIAMFMCFIHNLRLKEEEEEKLFKALTSQYNEGVVE